MLYETYEWLQAELFIEVLILILMEYALWDAQVENKDSEKKVLILILMELLYECLMENHFQRLHRCLNPYSNGICSERWRGFSNNNAVRVLILILMEYALWVWDI